MLLCPRDINLGGNELIVKPLHLISHSSKVGYILGEHTGLLFPKSFSVLLSSKLELTTQLQSESQQSRLSHMTTILTPNSKCLSESPNRRLDVMKRRVFNLIKNIWIFLKYTSQAIWVASVIGWVVETPPHQQETLETNLEIHFGYCLYTFVIKKWRISCTLSPTTGNLRRLLGHSISH